MTTYKRVKMPDGIYKRLCSEYKNLKESIFLYEEMLESGSRFSQGVARRLLPRLNGRYEEICRILEILCFDVH